MKKRVLIILAEGFEEIEAVTSIDIMRRAGLDVTIAGLGKELILGSRGLSVKADMPLDSYKGTPDAVVLPGGLKGVQNLAASDKVKDIIESVHKTGNIIAAICAAPAYVLAPMGLLNGKSATCYPSESDKVKDIAKYKDQNVVVDGNIITSKGPGTAFDFALKVVEVLRDGTVKENVRKATLYGESQGKL
ncbi:MAG: DJ-1/PfpI family protein [Candidatus Omnitrophica bacterium]|nr:DJ-1/PfpI family protein [Candidatus Omnitrophota bacterium]